MCFLLFSFYLSFGALPKNLEGNRRQETRDKKQETGDKRQDIRITNHDCVVIQSEAKNLPRDKLALTLKRYTIPFLNAQSNSEAKPKNLHCCRPPEASSGQVPKARS